MDFVRFPRGLCVFVINWPAARPPPRRRFSRHGWILADGFSRVRQNLVSRHKASGGLELGVAVSPEGGRGAHYDLC